MATVVRGVEGEDNLRVCCLGDFLVACFLSATQSLLTGLYPPGTGPIAHNMYVHWQ